MQTYYDEKVKENIEETPNWQQLLSEVEYEKLEIYLEGARGWDGWATP